MLCLLLAGEYNLFVLNGEAESFSEIEQQLQVSTEPTMMHETSRLHINKGKKVHEVSPRQIKRKLAHCKSSAEQALWFCESFGLQPESLQLRKQTGSPIKIDFSSSSSHMPQHQKPTLSPTFQAYCVTCEVLTQKRLQTFLPTSHWSYRIACNFRGVKISLFS